MTAADDPMIDHSEREEMLARAQAFVDRKYVVRADERQKSMGLAYVEAERQDLAREITRFAMSELSLRSASTGAGYGADQSVEDQVETACKAYAQATDYYVPFHRGLSSESSDKMRKGMRAALAAIAALPAPGGESVTEEELASIYGSTLARTIFRNYTIQRKSQSEAGS